MVSLLRTSKSHCSATDSAGSASKQVAQRGQQLQIDSGEKQGVNPEYLHIYFYELRYLFLLN